MRAIILAAGLGTRLRPMTNNTSKALIKVKDKPLVEYQIEYLKEKGIDEIIIVVGYLHEQFDYLKEKYNVKLVLNDKYAEYNNFYSLYLVKDYLGHDFVSRSLAKRILMNVEKFKVIVLDFENIDNIGQGFADEVFRVFKNKNPDITIVPINMNEEIEFMINRAMKK